MPRYTHFCRRQQTPGARALLPQECALCPPKLTLRPAWTDYRSLDCIWPFWSFVRVDLYSTFLKSLSVADSPPFFRPHPIESIRRSYRG
jgi:hypothetical protein